MEATLLRGIGSLLCAAVLCATPARSEDVVRIADETGSATARRAIEECNQASAERSRKRAIAKLDDALALAEQAVEADAKDAKAHFAIFCSLGRRAELEGGGLEGLSSLGRLRNALDEALELEPRFIDAIVAKGRLLGKLPWMLGGDAEEGERLIRHALELDPDSAVARLQLAHLMAEQGEDSKAKKLALAAIDLADQEPAPRRIRDEASTLVARLES